MPAVARLLGVGDAILPIQTPRWLRFPYLRLGHLVETSAICSEYGIQAAKVSFGGVQLTSAAFGVQPAELYADHLASYTSTGNFNSDLGALVYQDPLIVRRIMRFRNSSDGEAFRREVGQVLAVGGGAEFRASVDAGLSRTIPPGVLQRARDKLLTLMTESARVAPVPAVWGNVPYPDSITKRWRARSERMLLEMCSARGLGKDDPCICGSGEKLRLCCLAPLRR
jgi:SEC-C motif